MRKVLVLVSLTATMLAVGSPPATAGGSVTRETHSERRFWTQWRERKRISSDSYYAIRWEVSAFDVVDGSDEEFGANLFRIAYRCPRTTDPRQCVTASILVGKARGPELPGFALQQNLKTASLSGIWTLSHVNHAGAEKVVHVAATLTALGEPSLETDNYTLWDGNCPATQDRFTGAATKGLADVTITGDFEVNRTGLRTTWLDDREETVTHRTC